MKKKILQCSENSVSGNSIFDVFLLDLVMAGGEGTYPHFKGKTLGVLEGASINHVTGGERGRFKSVTKTS